MRFRAVLRAAAVFTLVLDGALAAVWAQDLIGVELVAGSVEAEAFAGGSCTVAAVAAVSVLLIALVVALVVLCAARNRHPRSTGLARD